MAVEAKRGCGYRKVGGLYLVGNYISVPCDRLPYPIHECPVCGAGIHFTRGITRINPLKLFGNHDDILAHTSMVTSPACHDKIRPCFMCDPTDDPAYIMFVGERYYPTVEDFSIEAQVMGVSKRIPGNSIPKDLLVGKTIIYLAHPKACKVREPAGVMQEAMAILDNQQARLCDAEQEKPKPAIFSAFIPQRLEKICWQSDYTSENIERHKRRGIDLVPVPDNDLDHK